MDFREEDEMPMFHTDFQESIRVIARKFQIDPLDLEVGVDIYVRMQGCKYTTDVPLEYARQLAQHEFEWWRHILIKYHVESDSDYVFCYYTGTMKIYEEVLIAKWEAN